MDDLGFNKIAGAVLATFLVMLLLMKLPSVFMAHAGEEIAYDGGFDPNKNKDKDAPVIDLPFPQADWVSAMDAAKGAKVFKKCKSCHNAEAGGPNGTGPALYGIVGNDIASTAGFKYSSAITGLEGNWTYEALDAFLKKPSKYAPGTNMNFVGLKKPTDRAAVIEYLRLADPAPEALPVAKSAEAEMSKEDMVDGTMEKMEKTEMVDDTMEKTETVEETMEKSEMVDAEMVKDEMVKDEMVKENMIKEEMVKEEIIKEEMIKDKKVKEKIEDIVKDKIKDIKVPN